MASFLNRVRSSIADAIAPRPVLSSPSTSSIPTIHASNSSGVPYDAGSNSRRARGWNPSRQGPTTTLWTSLDKMVPRSRDAIRNDPWAASAIDNFESQVISTGIRPRWKIKNKARREEVEREWARWCKKCDVNGQSSFYGLQAIAAREMFEAGEVFCRKHIRPKTWGMRIPLQLQLLESEQLPLWRTALAPNGGQGVPSTNSIRAGIEFDADERRTAYHFFKHHPGETMFFPTAALTQIRIPAEFILQTFRPLRAGQLRGQPHLASVLTLLYELEQYNDAELMRKKIQAMFAFFIEKTSPDIEVLPNADTDPNNANANSSRQPDLGTATTKLESGSINELFPGEKITYPQLPQDTDFAAFMRVEGHRFASAIGATYEQLTGDLNGVTYSSIRAGLLDFRRKCEMLQHQIFVHQFCQPIAEWWLEEAVMAGVLDLPGYASDPDKYTDILWTPSGWDWVDPLKDVQADIFAIRAGLTTRAHVVAERGRDVTVLDEEWVSDRDRAHELDLVYDTDPSQVLTKGARNPTLDEHGNPIAPPIDNAPSSQPDNQPKPKPVAVPKKAAQLV